MNTNKVEPSEPRHWKSRLGSLIGDKLSREIDAFQGQIEQKREGKLTDEVFAEMRLRRPTPQPTARPKSPGKLAERQAVGVRVEEAVLCLQLRSWCPSPPGRGRRRGGSQTGEMLWNL